MMGLPIIFGAPTILLGLLVLPIIWWLLRMTPPRPVVEIFPPLAILTQIPKREETPQKSPWWLTLLRLILAAAVIIALARPLLNPENPALEQTDTLAIMIDNSWATTTDWPARVTTARALINEAGENDQKIAMAFTAAASNLTAGPFDAADALTRLDAARPEPVPADRAIALRQLSLALGDSETLSFAFLSDNLNHGNDAIVAGNLSEKITQTLLITAQNPTFLAITAAQNQTDSLVVTLQRSAETATNAVGILTAFDSQSRPLGEAEFAFTAGQLETEANFQLPVELRNDFQSIRVNDGSNAALTYLLDDSAQRRRVALLAASDADEAQPLLAPLYYIERALQPFADSVRPAGDDLDTTIEAAINQRISVMVLADIGVLPDNAATRLTEWVNNGGTLIRFAGPRLAASTPERDDPLLPVHIRSGERALGGALSWSEPQAIASFPENSPFAGLEPPRDVAVDRQILAEPDIDTPERTWANLTDGTPLVTGVSRGNGTVVLFHIAPDATWSNLPISGSFVNMLSTLVRLSSTTAIDASSEAEDGTVLPPLRILNAVGQLIVPPSTAEPVASGQTAITFANPPGLYGTSEAYRARNLFNGEADFSPFELGEGWSNVTRSVFASDRPSDLRPWLFALATALLALDGLIMLLMTGAFKNMGRKRPKAPAIAALLLGVSLAAAPSTPFAQEVPPQPLVNSADVVDAISETRLAYFLTGDRTIDQISEAGLFGLSEFLRSRTALEPGKPAALDPATDELAFYPIIYWPISANATMPTPATIARIDAYMNNGGTILFDTRDRLSAALNTGTQSPEIMRLRAILSSLNVPALEPVPLDHVLTKSFFILENFPGRYDGGALWVEASQAEDDSAADRPVRRGDGVTSIIITSNDLAAAWAMDETGRPLLPTVPNDPLQRLYAFRSGVNIVMYMLTGNYKADQVHIPALLERLGQ